MLSKMHLIKLSLCAATIFATQSSFAGGCKMDEVKLGDDIASRLMAENVQDRIRNIESEMKSKGEQMELVMVARMGESLDSLALVKDNLDQKLEEYLRYLSKEAHKNKYVKSNGKIVELDSRKARLKQSMYEKRKLEFSHFGFVVRSSHIHREARDWEYVYHLLAECDLKNNRYGQSGITFEPFSRFFWGSDMLKKKKTSLLNRGLRSIRLAKKKSASYPGAKALIVVPRIDIQKRLIKHFESERQTGGRFHRPTYNVIAAPFHFKSTKQLKLSQDIASGKRKKKKRDKLGPDSPYQLKNQNSNQWPLEMLAASTKAYLSVKDDKDAQQVLLDTNYHPSIVSPRSNKVFGGIKEYQACGVSRSKFLKKRLKVDISNLLSCEEQAFEKEALLQVITVDSVVRYLDHNKFLAGTQTNNKVKGTYVVNMDSQLVSALAPFIKKKKASRKQVLLMQSLVAKATEDEEIEDLAVLASKNPNMKVNIEGEFIAE